MFLHPTNSTEIVNIIKNLKEGSPGWDNIGAKVIKECIDIFIDPLTHIVNLSLSNGIFPKELKVAIVLPLFKAGDGSVFTNYRPVSILSVISKVFEKRFYKRLLDFVHLNKLINVYQFGFRQQHSTYMALLILIEKITSALEKGEVVIWLF